MANRINKYFIDSIKLIIEEISAPRKNYVDHEIVYNGDVLEEFPTVNKFDLDEIVDKLKNVGSEELVNAKILKEVWDLLGCKILYTVNKSFKDCTVSGLLKVSCITPIPKVLNSIALSVNVLPLVDKILESIIFNMLTTHVNKHEILSLYQLSFWQKHSTKTAFQLVIES